MSKKTKHVKVWCETCKGQGLISLGYNFFNEESFKKCVDCDGKGYVEMEAKEECQ